MVGTNDFLPFGVSGGANVISQASYSGLQARLTGFIAGTAASNELNKVWRQGAFVAAMIGQFTSKESGQNADDNGNLDEWESEFKTALRAFAGLRRAATGGSASIATIAFNPPFASYSGLVFLADITTSLAAGATLNVDGLGARNLLRLDGTAIQIGDAPAGSTLLLAYDGAAIKILNLTTYAIQSGSTNFAVDSGSADALVATLVPPVPSYRDGLRIWVKKGANPNATTTPTINVNSLGDVPIVKRNGGSLFVGDLPGNTWIMLLYDSGAFRVLGAVASDFAPPIPPYAQIRQVRAQGTPPQSGATTTAGTGNWITRLLNTIVTNTIPGASLNVGSGVITLPAGSYWADFTAQSNSAGSNRARLYDRTANVELLTSPVGDSYPYLADMVTVPSIGKGRFTLTQTTQISLDHVNFDMPTSFAFNLGDDSHAAAGTFSLIDADLVIEREL